MREGYLEARPDQLRGVGHDDSQRSLSFKEGHADNQDRTDFSEVTQIDDPKFTALDEWEGHADRLGPRFQPRVGPILLPGLRRSLLRGRSTRPRVGAAPPPEEPEHFALVQSNSSRALTLPVDDSNFKP